MGLILTMIVTAAILHEVGESPTRFLTRVEVAQLLRTSPKTVADWDLRSCGPPSSKVGRRRLYRLDEVLAWVDEQKDAVR